MNTVEKLNTTYQSTANAIPRAIWEKHRHPHSPDHCRLLDLKHFRHFGEYGWIPRLEAIKSKSEPRSTLVRYLTTPRTGIYRVLDPKIGQIMTCRARDYRPYNPAYDPRRFIAHALPLKEGHKRNVNLHYAIPLMASVVEESSSSPSDEWIPDRPLVSSLPDPPRSLLAAKKHKYAAQWRQAYAEEKQKLDDHGTFTTVPRSSLPPKAFVPRAQIRFVYKENDFGQLIGFKARVLYPGDRLTPSVHYDPKATATYSADCDCLRIVIASAAQDEHQLYHVDIKSAFLHEEFQGKTPLYLQMLPNFDEPAGRYSQVNMLTANLYGTPQACKVYIDGAYAHLKQHGYQQCASDQNVFRKETSRGKIVMALTVDDFLVAASTPAIYKDLLDTLKIKYKVKDLGHATGILNWTVTRPVPGKCIYHVSQPHKTQHFIELMGMTRSHPTKTPQAPGHPLTARRPDEPPLSATYPYAAALGVLRYIADCTRPDIAFITGTLARHTRDPALRHWQAMQYVARYLNGTRTEGLLYDGTAQQLRAYADADFADCRDTRQSTNGNILYFAGTPISWCSRRIKTVVTSTCAAEYISNSKTGEHVTWLRSLLKETSKPQAKPTKLFNDNTAAEDIANSRGQTKRSKYIEVRWHHVRDLIARKMLQIVHIPSADLVADALTKCLPAPAFLRLKGMMKLTKPL